MIVWVTINVHKLKPDETRRWTDDEEMKCTKLIWNMNGPNHHWLSRVSHDTLNQWYQKRCINVAFYLKEGVILRVGLQSISLHSSMLLSHMICQMMYNCKCPLRSAPGLDKSQYISISKCIQFNSIYSILSYGGWHLLVYVLMQ